MEEITVIVDDLTEEVSLGVSSPSGVSDHTLLTNIGTKTHATLDTEVGLNTAKVSLPSGGTAAQVLSKIDGTDHNTEWADARGGGGGGGFQIYEYKGYLDSALIANWIKTEWDSTKMGYTGHAFTAKTNSGVTISNAHIGLSVPFGVAKGEQTVESLSIFVGRNFPTDIDGISIIKVVYTDMATDDILSKEELYEGVISMPLSGLLQIPSSSFTDTSIADGDVLYLFLSSSTLNTIASVNVTLKCSID